MISATSLLIGIGCGFATALFVNLLVEGFSRRRIERMLKKQFKLDRERRERQKWQ